MHITVEEMLSEFQKLEKQYESGGLTSQEIRDATGWSLERVRRMLLQLCNEGLMEVRMVPKPTVIPGRTTLKPVYVLKSKKSRGK